MALNIYPITTTGKKWMWRRKKKKNKEKGIIMRERVIDQRDSSLSPACCSRIKTFVCVCLLLAPGFGFTGPEVPAISCCQIKKNIKRKEKETSKKREMTKSSFSLVFSFDVFIRSESSVSTSDSCESNKKRGLRTKAS
jgi:hypothetical protein